MNDANRQQEHWELLVDFKRDAVLQPASQAVLAPVQTRLIHFAVRCEEESGGGGEFEEMVVDGGGQLIGPGQQERSAFANQFQIIVA